MGAEIPGMQLSSGAASLLRVALENDPQCVIAKNATLTIGIDLAIRYFWQKPPKSASSLLENLGERGRAASFLELVSAFLCSVRAAVLEGSMCQGQSDEISYATDFDWHVLHAFSLTFADMAWPLRSGQDFDGPSATTTIDTLQRSSKSSFFMLLAQNYIGDILQDYFARAGVRRQYRNLPEDREANLRLVDAKSFVDQMISRLRESGGLLETSADFRQAVQATLRLIES